MLLRDIFCCIVIFVLLADLWIAIRRSANSYSLIFISLEASITVKISSYSVIFQIKNFYFIILLIILIPEILKHSSYLKSLEIINNINEECPEFSEEKLSESEMDHIEQYISFHFIHLTLRTNGSPQVKKVKTRIFYTAWSYHYLVQKAKVMW